MTIEVHCVVEPEKTCEREKPAVMLEGFVGRGSEDSKAETAGKGLGSKSSEVFQQSLH